MPVELRPRIWLPVMPVITRVILQAAISSASRTACRMLCTQASILTTTPRFMPLLGDTPKPSTFSAASACTSATTHMILLVPMSSPTIKSLYSLATVSYLLPVSGLLSAAAAALSVPKPLSRRA